MIHAAVIGVTGYGKFYLSQLLRLQKEGRIQLDAMAVINPDEAIDEMDSVDRSQTKIYYSLDELLEQMAGKIDLCCIPVGIPDHASIAIKAIETGANILLEKPVAGSVGDALKINSSAKKHGIEVMIGFQHLYQDVYHDLKNDLINGRLGKIKHMTLTGIWPRGHKYFERNAWAGRKKFDEKWVLDSPANNAFAHYLNLALFLSSNQIEDSAVPLHVKQELYRTYPIENFDTMALRAVLNSGVVLHAFLSHAGDEIADPKLLIHCDKGDIIIFNGGVEVSESDGNRQLQCSKSENLIRQEMFDAVIDVLEGIDRHRCSPELAMAHTWLINALNEFGNIHTLDRSFIREKGDHLIIPGLYDIFLRCAESFKLPAEIGGVPWAKESPEADCVDYRGIL
ncbi:MAG: Gfo/Idh/MocA family protein [Flavobacteriales bacterium]